MSVSTLLTFLTFLPLVFGFASHAKVTPLEEGPKYDASVDRQRFPQADAVVLDETAKLRFFHDDRGPGYELSRRVRMKILTPAGRRYARVATFMDQWSELISASGRSFGPLLVPTTISANAIAYAASSVGEVFSSDSHLAFFDIPSVDVNDVIEYETVTRTHQVFWLPAWAFNAELPVLVSELDVEVPKGFSVIYSYSEEGSLAQFEPEVRGDWNIFKRRDLPALEHEPFDPPMATRQMRLAIAVAQLPKEFQKNGPALKTWDDIARWYRELSAGLFDFPKELAATTTETSSPQQPGPTPLDGLKSPEQLLSFVKNRTRYLAIHQGMGAIKAHKASEVYDRGYGDCKDMATLLVSLLRWRGISAYPTLIGFKGHNPFDPSRPAFDYFDHMIVAIPRAKDSSHSKDAGYLFLDPTDQTGAFGELAPPLQGQPALVILDQGHALVTTPVASEGDVGERIRWQIGRDYHLSLEVELLGTSAKRLRRLVDGSEKDLVRSVEQSYASELPDARVLHASLEPMKEGPPGSLLLRAEISATPFIELKDRLLLPLKSFLPSASEFRVPRERKHPAEVGLPKTIVEQVSLKLRDGLSVEHLPKSFRIDDAIMTSNFSTAVEARSISIERSFVLHQELVDVPDLDKIRRASEALFETAREVVVLRKSKEPEVADTRPVSHPKASVPSRRASMRGQP